MLCTTFPCSLHLPTRKVRSHSGLETAQAVRGGAQAGSSCPTQDLQIQRDKDARQHEELREPLASPMETVTAVFSHQGEQAFSFLANPSGAFTSMSKMEIHCLLQETQQQSE